MTNEKDTNMKKTAEQIADRVLEKLAEIAEEDIRQGLRGTPSREITPEEVDAYVQTAVQAQKDRTKKFPLHSALLFGGMSGLGLGALGSLDRPNRLRNMGIGAAIGALGGGIGGYGLGIHARNLGAERAKTHSQFAADIARTGKIPQDLPRDYLDTLPRFALGPSVPALEDVEASIARSDTEGYDKIKRPVTPEDERRFDRILTSQMRYALKRKGYAPLAEAIKNRPI